MHIGVDLIDCKHTHTRTSKVLGVLPEYKRILFLYANAGSFGQSIVCAAARDTKI